MKLGYKILLVSALLTVAGITTLAGETATLRNGYSILFDRRELRGESTRLFLSASPEDFVDVPTDEIIGFEEEGMAPIPLARPLRKTNDLTDLEEVVSAASSHNNISPDLIKSVIFAESGFNRNAVSRKGAQGLMQLMPQTAARMGVQNALDPSENVEGGTRYLRELLGVFHNDVVKALAAYNAGPQRVEQYHGVPPYPETVAYVNRVIRNWNQPSTLTQHSPVDAGAQSTNRTANKSSAVKRKSVRESAPAPRPGASPYIERHPLSSD